MRWIVTRSGFLLDIGTNAGYRIGASLLRAADLWERFVSEGSRGQRAVDPSLLAVFGLADPPGPGAEPVRKGLSVQDQGPKRHSGLGGARHTCRKGAGRGGRAGWPAGPDSSWGRCSTPWPKGKVGPACPVGSGTAGGLFSDALNACQLQLWIPDLTLALRREAGLLISADLWPRLSSSAEPRTRRESLVFSSWSRPKPAFSPFRAGKRAD